MFIIYLVPVPPSSPSGFSSKNPEFQYLNNFSVLPPVLFIKKVIKFIKRQWDYLDDLYERFLSCVHCFALARKDSSNLVCSQHFVILLK